ncbi:PaaI family thioesterase [Fibrella sp. HMF5335]|uniref:PaaI family thioesterase n=1 Tax=Fibrella rubiginis TaxID=2817060 RepID=A0A939GC09_9BACT|nr:PaaI family thioesterase [Fibrella rubiginis]MBO0936267.1 PaaI family thioesterase [Fibrella rubiginis]
METNARLDAFRAFIGQPMTSSPSGVGRWLGGVLRVVEEGRMVASYVVRDDMVNPMQVLHGGTASAILDDLCGLTVFALGRDYGYTSVNLTVDFLSAARLGETLTAEAVVVRAGRNIVHVEGRITNAAGKLIAKCSTNLIQTGVKL